MAKIKFTTPLEIECYFSSWTRESILRHIEEVLSEYGSDELIIGLPELYETEEETEG